jgi:hypothetical protein
LSVDANLINTKLISGNPALKAFVAGVMMMCAALAL